MVESPSVVRTRMAGLDVTIFWEKEGAKLSIRSR